MMLEPRRGIAWRLNSATVHLSRALRRDTRSPLAAEHRSALGVVSFLGPIRMGTLAKVEGVGAPAMTKTVAALERHGLVRRVGDRGDRRAVLISATARGAAMVREGRDERVRRIDVGLQALSRSQRGRIRDALTALEALVRTLESGGITRAPRAASDPAKELR